MSRQRRRPSRLRRVMGVVLAAWIGAGVGLIVNLCWWYAKTIGWV